MPDETPEYDHEYTVGETIPWELPADVIPLAENDTHVKITLIDTLDLDTVHAEKEALRQGDWESVEEFREDVEWRSDAEESPRTACGV